MFMATAVSLSENIVELDDKTDLTCKNIKVPKSGS